jgi:hypothetical protein
LQVSPHEAEPNIPKYEYTRDDNPNRYPEMWAPSHCEINENSTVTWVKNGEGQARKAGVRLYGHDGGHLVSTSDIHVGEIVIFPGSLNGPLR